MRPWVVCFLIMLSIVLPKIESFNGIYRYSQMELKQHGTGISTEDNISSKEENKEENIEFSIAEFENMDGCITPMEALELVKEQFAANFVKVYHETEDEYYYKLAIADYYLVYEGEVGQEPQYLYHLYEFVIDEPDTGIGHTVTYGWYTVDKVTGEISEQLD